MEILKANLAKIATLVLLVADLGLAWPLYEMALQDPLAGIEAGMPVRPSAVSLRGQETETEVMRSGRPPAGLLKWDPFAKPRLRPDPAGPVTETDTVEPVVELYPISTDNINLLGIISLNGRYSALVTIGEETLELRGGMMVPGLENVRCAEVRRNGLLLTQPGALPTFVELKKLGLEAMPWYQNVDPGAIRGRIEMRK
jgi:hypothetical protein